MSSSYASGQNLSVNYCRLNNRLSYIPEIMETPTINTVSLGHLCELELFGDGTVSVTAFKFSFCNLDSSRFGWCYFRTFRI